MPANAAMFGAVDVTKRCMAPKKQH